jgi:anti-sigma B factor antagonist
VIKMTMTEPSFPVQVISGVPVVITPREIDITNAAWLRAALLRAAAGRGAILVVDMTRTRFCDSAGLHTLIGAHKRAQAEGRQVRLAVTGAQVRRILALTALDRLLSVYTSLDLALAHPPADSPRSQPENRPDSGQTPPPIAIGGSVVQKSPGQRLMPR